jgi:hypothetical protein
MRSGTGTKSGKPNFVDVLDEFDNELFHPAVVSGERLVPVLLRPTAFF